MDAKKARNAGVISVLSLALALGAGIAGSMSAGAQGQTATGNDKPDPSQPIVRSINGKSIVVAMTPDFDREVPVDASTLVVKDGKFVGLSALKVGDKVQVNPQITLPNGLEGHGTTSTSTAPQENTQTDPSNPDNKLGDEGYNGEGSSQPDAPGGTSAPNTPPAPSNPDNKENGVPTDSSQLPGEGTATAASSSASVIWVKSSDDVLLGGIVHWAQGDTAVLNLPGVAYSEYVIHTASSTGYQKMLSEGAAPSAANAADLKVGDSVIVLGNDGGSANAGYFTAKAILVLPASGKFR